MLCSLGVVLRDNTERLRARRERAHIKHVHMSGAKTEYIDRPQLDRDYENALSRWVAHRAFCISCQDPGAAD